jgi:transcriptional regulator with XRE-family HTH domain
MPKAPKRILPKLTESSESIGDRIAYYRKAKGLTQKQIAEKIGIDRILISDYERGRIRLYDEMLGRFALALGVTTDTLLGLNPPAHEQENPSLRLMKRVIEIDKLPEQKKKAILKTLDDLIKANS